MNLSSKQQELCETRGPGDRHGGFSLIELMIALVIAAIMMSVAVPMFEEGLKRNRRLGALESISGTIATARSEAVSRATAVAMCPSPELANCTGNNWEQGILVFEDDDQNGNLDSGEEIIRAVSAAGAGVTIRSHGTFVNLDTIIFDQFGGVDDAGTLVICDADDSVTSASGVVLNASGQARLAVDENNNGIINLINSDGDNIDFGPCP